MSVYYLANSSEDAVIKVTENGDRFVKFEGKDEFKAHPESNVANGSIECDLIEITKEDYNSFGKTWRFKRIAKKPHEKEYL